MNKGLLIVFSAPSGCGKGTIIKELLAKDSNMFYSVSATTRLPRPGEEHGVHYFFISKEEFEAMIASDGMLEHAKYVENYYGTPKQAVLDRLERGQDVLLEIEVQGAMQVKKRFPEAVMIFILPPSVETLRERLVGRGTESIETIERRVSAATQEMTYANEYDYLIVNDDLNEAISDVQTVIKAEKLRRVRQQKMLDTLLSDRQ